MITADAIGSIALKYQDLISEMDERTRRLWAASEARGIGYGGISAVARVTGMAISTIRTGLRELASRKPPGRPEQHASVRRVRHTGGGRKRLTQKDPLLTMALKRLVESTTRGDPMSPLRWTCKSTRVAQRHQSNGSANV